MISRDRCSTVDDTKLITKNHRRKLNKLREQPMSQEEVTEEAQVESQMR